MPISTVQNFIQRLIHNPLGAAALLYITEVIGALLYSDFQPRDELEIFSIEMLASSNMIRGHE